jgi:hypothetical protein
LPAVASWLVVFAPLGLWAWCGALAPWRGITVGWTLVRFGLYATYPVTSETWWSLRFVLTAIPPLIVAALAGLQIVAGRAPVVGALIAIVLLVRSPIFPAFRNVKSDERVYREALQVIMLEQPAPVPTLMVQMSGAANYYAPHVPLLRYDELAPGGWQAIAEWQARTHTPIRAALFPFERDELLGERSRHLKCAWTSRGHYRHITFWECAP